MPDTQPDYRRLVKQYQLAYAMCRNWGHPWEWQGDTPRPDGGWDTHLYCRQCTKSRIRMHDARGYPIGNRYPDAPKDYSIPGLPWDTTARAAMATEMHSPRVRKLMAQLARGAA